MLHTINKSPYSHHCLTECLRVCNAGDVILLIEDGVYAGLANSEFIDATTARVATVYALQSDVEARGLSARLASTIKTVDYAGFVQL